MIDNLEKLKTMETIYRVKAKELNSSLIDNIRQMFQDDEELTITIASQKESSGSDKVQKFLELERTYPPKQVPKDLDFNTVVDEMNL